MVFPPPEGPIIAQKPPLKSLLSEHFKKKDEKTNIPVIAPLILFNKIFSGNVFVETLISFHVKIVGELPGAFGENVYALENKRDLSHYGFRLNRFKIEVDTAFLCLLSLTRIRNPCNYSQIRPRLFQPRNIQCCLPLCQF